MSADCNGREIELTQEDFDKEGRFFISPALTCHAFIYSLSVRSLLRIAFHLYLSIFNNRVSEQELGIIEKSVKLQLDYQIILIM